MKQVSKLLVVLMAVAVGLVFASCGGSTSMKPSAKTGDPTKDYKNIAIGQPTVANNHIYGFVAANAVDGDVTTYYEGAANSYPNILTVDLGAVHKIHAISIKLNPARIWQARVQTFEVDGSADNTTFTTILPSTNYQFDPLLNKNTVVIPFEASTRYLRINFTANDGSTGGQIGELSVFGE